MSVTSPNAPTGPIPERVAIETPRGNIRAGRVVETQWVADADGIERWYVVSVDGARFRRPAADVAQATQADVP